MIDIKFRTWDETKSGRMSVEDKMRTIDFQVDTLDIRDDEKSWGGHSGWGLNSKGVITANYNIYESGYINDNSIDNYTLYVHEQKHRDNMENGIYEYPMSLEQAYKINMHDEISATMTELLQLREEYIQTGDISIFDKTPKLNFYKVAIEKGEIKPNSPYQEDFDKEMSFIVNGTRDMWVDNYSGMYVEQNSYFATASYDDSGKYAQYYDENYERAKKIAYNIGGVDFTKYMYKDVEIPQDGYAEMLEDMHNYRKDFSLIPAQVFEKSGFPPYDGGMSLYEYKKLLQHQMAINNFASGHGWVNQETGESKTYSKEEYLKSLNSKETIEGYKKMYEEITSPEITNVDEVKEQYPTFEVFLKDMQSFETRDYQEKFNEATRNEAFIDKIVEYQAAEYAKTGKYFPQNNQQNYQKALNKIYCGAYNILKPDETKLKSELSYSAEKLQNSSAWERTMKNYLKSVGLSPKDAEYYAHNFAQENKIIGGWGCFVGGPFVGAYNKVKDLKHRMTHIVDENGEEQNVGLWGKIKHKASQIKKDLTTEIEVDENGEEWKGKCSVWKGLKNKVSNWFKASPQQEPVKNEPTHPVNKGAPEYPKWSNDNRVSEVQHREILDLRKPIIKQPTLSKADNQQNNTSHKTATVVKMKIDAVKAQEAAGQPEYNSDENKVALKDTMKQDSAKVKEIFENIDKQEKTTEKVARITPAVHSQTKVLKDLYHRLFDR